MGVCEPYDDEFMGVGMQLDVFDTGFLQSVKALLIICDDGQVDKLYKKIEKEISVRSESIVKKYKKPPCEGCAAAVVVMLACGKRSWVCEQDGGCVAIIPVEMN